MKKVFNEIKEAVKKAKSAVIAAHIDPDGDAIGSMLALGMALETLGIAVTIYSEDGAPRIYRFLPGSEKIKNSIFPAHHYDLAFVLDSSDLCRVGQKINLREMSPVLINIDHHPDNTQFGNINYVMKTASVAEEIYDLIKFLKVKITRQIADCLYAAMITDTGNFRYENTTVKTFLIAAELLKAGVNTHEISTLIYDTKSLAAVRILAKAMAEIKFSPDRKVAWTAVTEQMMNEAGARGEDLIGIVDKLRGIEGVEVAIFFREDKDKVKMNFRSKEKTNVSEIAKRFNGGGHKRAAGAILDGPMDKAQEQVIGGVLKYMEAAKFLV